MSLLLKIEQLLNHEELIKNKKAMKAILRNAALLRDPKISNEERATALDNLENLTGQIKKQAKTAKLASKKEALSGLDSALNLGQQGVDKIHNRKIKENLQAQQEKLKAQKEEVAQDRWEKRQEARLSQEDFQVKDKEWQQKMEKDPDNLGLKDEYSAWRKRVKILLPGSNVTQEELEAHAKRNYGEKEEKEVKAGKPVTAIKKDQLNKEQIQRKLDEVYGHVHKLHADNNHDAAYDVLSKLHPSHFTGKMAQYRPEYIHYDITPQTWQSYDQNAKNFIHEKHNEIVNGVHDNTDHPHLKLYTERIKKLKQPKDPQ